MSGSKLGKYEIVKRLATGGMAEIFLASVSGLPGFQKMVVIKRILPQLASKSDFVEMFLDEARIAATLQHPNVVQTYDVGVVDGNYFIAMEYLHGEDVRSLMKALMKLDERLPLEHALNVLIGVCSGLHYAHEKVGFDGRPLHIVHRDCTPQNVIVTYEGGVKLLDFGIAKASNRFGETRFGTLKGKVPYMSPEQCKGEPLDRRSDIFSLGIMLYELTLGKRLYRGASDFEILKQIVEGTVTPPSQIDPKYNPHLERIVMKGLEKEKDKRYQTARELQADLEALVREEKLYVSPIALAQFMEHVFGQKIEAWREAQARGATLSDHLQQQPEVMLESLDDEDLVEIDPATAEAEERAQKERAALIQSIEERNTPGAAALKEASPPSLIAQPWPGARGAGQRRWLPLALASAGVLAVAGVAALKHWNKREAPPPKLTAAPPVTPVVTPVAPPPVAAPKPAVGIAKVKTTPPGATLYLDGRKLDGSSPITVDELEAGPEHALLVQLDGYDDAMARFTVDAGAVKELDLTLSKPAPGKQAARVREPARATAGKHARKAVKTAIELPPPLAAPASPPVAAPPPEPKAAEPAKLDGEGTLVLASSPWCNVTVDGADKGPTPLRLTLHAGKHTLVLSNPEFKINRSLQVMINPGETVRKKLDFN